MAKAPKINGALDKSIHINKSDLPLAFNTLIFNADNGVNILAKQYSCIIVKQGSHFSVRTMTMNDLDNMKNNIINGNTNMAVENKAFLYKRNTRSLSSLISLITGKETEPKMPKMKFEIVFGV